MTNDTTTKNGMPAFSSTTNPLVDLFFSFGAFRGKSIASAFSDAYEYDPELAIRIALWGRDIRHGAGERRLFRDVLCWLEQKDPEMAARLIPKISEIGRWDDYFVFETPAIRMLALANVAAALSAGNALAAKWCPRERSINKEVFETLLTRKHVSDKKNPESKNLATQEWCEKKREKIRKMPFAIKLQNLTIKQRQNRKNARDLRKALKMTPSQYRRMLSNLTNVVETRMCANEWDEINFNAVPSIAAARYKAAFRRHTDKFAEYTAKLANGDTTVKVNASAIYPYDILKNVRSLSEIEKMHVNAQWKSLPNYVGNAKILPMVDSSGSMLQRVSHGNLTALDVAVSLGLYLAEKNTGIYKDVFLTFSGKPTMVKLTGDVATNAVEMATADWDQNTNLEAALLLILDSAISGNIPQCDMPEMLFILSDMQFDSTEHNVPALDMITIRYEEAGYKPPIVVFWNIAAHNNVPTTVDKTGVALVSGFSPSIASTLLAADPNDFTPVGIMMATIMNERYNF